MDEKYIITDEGSRQPVTCMMERFDLIREHMHNNFELTLIVAGSCTLRTDDEIFALKADDIFCINPLTLHELHGIDCVSVSVSFDQNYFEKMLPLPFHPRFSCNSAHDSSNKEALDQLRTLVARIIKNNVDRLDGYELRTWSMIYSIMDVFYRNFRIKQSASKEKNNFRYSQRIIEISQIVQSHYTENLTLTELAGQVHLSVPYLSKFFTEQFGMNFLTYLNQYRMMHAVTELTSTDKKIDDIALDSGFPNSHAFVTLFKKEYGILPKDYRKKQKAENASDEQKMASHNYIAGLKKYLQNSDSTGKVVSPQKEQDLEIALPDSGIKLHHSERTMMTVGRASDILIKSVAEMVHTAQCEIGFRFMKLTDIFSDELHVVSTDAEGRFIYSFEYTDIIIDFLYDEGLLPWIQLSYMPQALAKYPDRYLFGSLVSEPASIKEWCALVSAFLSHCRKRYGITEMRKWKFSLWNQPDTDTRLFGFSSDEYFFRFYKETYRCIRQFDSDLIFCLPPTYYIVGEEYVNYADKFLIKCRENDCLPDCLTFTYYDTDMFSAENHSKESFGFQTNMSLSENQNGLKDCVMQILHERKEYGLNSLPVYLTEWNNTPSQQDLLNDTCFKSCYIVKNILENYDRIESFTYQALTDLMKDAPIPDKLFFGGLGLFTKNGIPKAGYNAMKLLSRLGDTFLGRGDGYFVTKSNNGYQIMLYNYSHFTHLYANGEKFDMTETDRYTVFADSAPVLIHIQLKGLPCGSYEIRESFINRNCGSSFDKWIEMGATEPSSAEDTDIIKKSSAPGYHHSVAEISDDGIFRADVELALLEVRLIEISPCN